MKLKRIFSSRASNNYLLSLDIGTEFVKVLVLDLDREHHRAKVVGFGQVRQQLGHMSNGAVSDINGVINACSLAIEQAEKMAKVKKVSKVIMGIAGELVKGTTTTVHYERSQPEVRIDFPELKNIIQKVQWKAFDRIKKQLAWETGQNEIDVKLINANIVSVKIDGYRITNPVGFQGRDVSISVFNAYAPMVHLGALQKIADELECDILAIAAEPYAIAQSISTYNNPEFGAIIVDIGGGTTDVALVKAGGLEGTVMFGLGGRAFTKRLAKSLGLKFNEAEALKLNYSLGQTGAGVTEQVRKIFQDDCRIWMDGFKIALESFVSLDLFPSRILLCGGGSGLPDIKQVLENTKWSDEFPITQAPQISYLQPRDVVNLSDQTNKLNSPQHVAPLGLANLALDILAEEENILSDILGKAVKIVQ